MLGEVKVFPSAVASAIRVRDDNGPGVDERDRFWFFEAGWRWSCEDVN